VGILCHGQINGSNALYEQAKSMWTSCRCRALLQIGDLGTASFSCTSIKTYKLVNMLSLRADVSIQKTCTTIIYFIASEKALALVLSSWLPSDPHLTDSSRMKIGATDVMSHPGYLLTSPWQWWPWQWDMDRWHFQVMWSHLCYDWHHH